MNICAKRLNFSTFGDEYVDSSFFEFFVCGDLNSGKMSTLLGVDSSFDSGRVDDVRLERFRELMPLTCANELSGY